MAENTWVTVDFHPEKSGVITFGTGDGAQFV